jgi:hypothetical protein
MNDPIKALEDWDGKGKPFWLQLGIDDGYGATDWKCNLYKLKEEIVSAIGCPEPDMSEWDAELLVSSEEDDYEGFLLETHGSPRTLWVRSKSKPGEWPGLARVILAACAAGEKLLQEQP